MTVTIPALAQHEGIFSITVEISDNCPICGALRGTPYDTLSYDGSRRLHVSGWRNACGHIDKYEDVRKEAEAMKLSKPA